MIEQIQRFLQALDEALVAYAEAGERLDVYPIGRAALILHYGLSFQGGATKDFDVIQIGHPPTRLARKASELFGPGTPNARSLGLYLEWVQDGLPPLAPNFERRANEMIGEWQVLRLWQLDIHDLVVTKLKSFRPQDRVDLQFLCDQGSLQVDRLRELLESAFRWTTPKDGDPDRDRAFDNLERVCLYLKGQSRAL